LRGVEGAEEKVERAISSGAAFEKLAEFVRAQGGDADALAELPVSGEVREVEAPGSGYVARIGALGVGRAALVLGAGRERKGDRVDPGAGVEVLVSVGERVEEGQPVARLYGSKNIEEAERLILGAMELSGKPATRPPAILGSL